MLPVTRSCLVVVLYLSLSGLVSSQSAPASVQAPEVIYSQTDVEWPAPVPDAGLLLTVSGPDGLYLKQEQPAGSWARFSLMDAQGLARPDGVYKWEVVIQAGWETAAQRRESGWFQIQGGRVVAQGRGENQPVVVEETAPDNSIYVDQEGRLGIGTSVPGAQLHLKGMAPAIAIEDTQAGGREYRLRSLETGDGSLGLFDQTAGVARWLVDKEGRMGINTIKPTSTFTVDGYVESTKGFLVNGRPVGGIGLMTGSKPLYVEQEGRAIFGYQAGPVNTALNIAFFGCNAGNHNTSGAGNAFFGQGAGYYNSTADCNSFFGAFSGVQNTTGPGNSFFGFFSGYNNTGGRSNSFFGYDAGLASTLEYNNTMIGASADFRPYPGPGAPYPMVTNATALGYRAYVTRSDSLVLGGVNGFNGATAETFVGIGTTSPDRQLVVEGSQAIGKFRRFNATAADFAPAFLFERARGTNTAPLDILPGDYLGKVQFRGRVTGNMPEYGALTFIASDTSQNGRFAFVDRDLITERMVVLNTGNVGIGTNAPTEALEVAGNLRVRQHPLRRACHTRSRLRL